MTLLMRWLLFSVALGLSVASPAASAVIDSFDSGAPFDIENVGSGASLSQSANVLGGVRSLVVSTRAVFDPALGLDLIETLIASNTRIDLTYTPNHADLASGADRFQVTTERSGTICPSCANALDILVITFDESGSRAFTLSASPIGLHDLPFGSADDLGSVTQVILELTFDGATGDSIRLTDFRTVPESQAIPLAVVVLAFSVCASRRQRPRVAE